MRFKTVVSNNEKSREISFLLGAGRSGTTLLYKLLCLHPSVAYISNYEDRFTWLPSGIAVKYANKYSELKVKSWFNSGNAYFENRPWAQKIFPTPNEGEAVYTACGLPSSIAVGHVPNNTVARALQQYFSKTLLKSNASIFLSKRTANNRRVPLLNSIFSDARFIHLIRDGREVAYSLSNVDWWDNHQVWWDGRTALQMEKAGESRLSICGRNWVKEIQELEKGLASVERERILEIRYEDLIGDPQTTLRKILNFLNIEMTSSYSKKIDSLDIKVEEPKWKKRWDITQHEEVLREQSLLLEKLKYK